MPQVNPNALIPSPWAMPPPSRPTSPAGVCAADFVRDTTSFRGTETNFHDLVPRSQPGVLDRSGLIPNPARPNGEGVLATNRAWFAVVFGALLALERLELGAPDGVLVAPGVLCLTLQFACSELREHGRRLDFRQPVLVAVDEQLVRYRWCAHGASSWPVVVCREDARPTREAPRVLPAGAATGERSKDRSPCPHPFHRR